MNAKSKRRAESRDRGALVNRLALMIEIPAVLVTMVMMLHVSVNALLRSFASSPIAYTNEVTEYWYMPIIVFLGFLAAQLRDEHVKADFIYNMLPGVTRKYILGVAYGVITVVSFGFAWYGAMEALDAFSTLRRAGISSLPAWPTYFMAPFAFGVLTVQFALVSVKKLSGSPRDDEEQGASPSLEPDNEEVMTRGE